SLHGVSCADADDGSEGCRRQEIRERAVRHNMTPQHSERHAELVHACDIGPGGCISRLNVVLHGSGGLEVHRHSLTEHASAEFNILSNKSVNRPVSETYIEAAEQLCNRTINCHLAADEDFPG